MIENLTEQGISQEEINEVYLEAKKQIDKFGIQNHTLTQWGSILTEEHGEAIAEINDIELFGIGNKYKLYKELIQVATVSLKIAKMIKDSQNKGKEADECMKSEIRVKNWKGKQKDQEKTINPLDFPHGEKDLFEDEKPSMDNTISDRINKINELIKIISEQDRGFFKVKNLLANFYLKEGKLFYQDDQNGESGEITLNTDYVKIGKWVTHGSTISQQIIDFAQFILTGRPQRLVSRYWGISHQSQKEIHNKAFEIGFIDYNSFEFYDYSNHKDVTYLINPKEVKK